MDIYYYITILFIIGWRQYAVIDWTGWS